MLRFFFFFLCFIQALTQQVIVGAKLPEITPHDVVTTMNQIMEAHVSHKALSPSLVQRALDRYLEELDPTKTYLLHSDVAKWIQATEPVLKTIQDKILKEDFTTFSEIHAQILPAIQRRNRLEAENQTKPLPKDVSIEEFKELDWAKNEEELSNRLIRIKALQVHATEKLDETSKEKALQRIVKRRLSREEELNCPQPLDRERFILSTVLKSFASSLDTHTAYFTPAEAAQFMIQVQQRLFGIGAQLRDDLNGFSIVKIIEGGPASRGGGLKVNDRIIAIDSEPVVGLDINDAVELIRGEEGTSVVLTVLRPLPEGEEKLNLEIVRGEVVIKEARIESSIIPFGDGVIAHISLHSFYQDPLHSSSSDLYEEITKIRNEHTVKGIVLDLRQNSGGVLPQAVAVTGLFITKGIVVSIKDNNGSVEHLRDVDGRTAYDGPLIVLTSKASASAAEIVSQTLQDYGRAIVVGDDHTYGKGTFQTFTLDGIDAGKINPKGEFKVTRGKYYTVSGKSPQLVGVVPDILVPGIFSTMEIGEKYAKFPLENDAITENYQDDLSDIPVVQREQISWLYRFNLQPRLKNYTRFLPILKKNAEARIAEDYLYQKFLADLNESELETSQVELYSKNDVQLKETVNIMKDLILLLN